MIYSKLSANLLLALLALFFGVSCSSKEPWPPQSYTEVRAFLYNLDSADALPCVDHGKLSPTVTDPNGVRLTDAQVTRLISAVTGSHPDHDIAGCYVPHHAYVFYDQQRQIKGWVELCFGCLRYETSSPKAPQVFDVAALQTLTIELGLPVLKKESEYPGLKSKLTK